MKTIPNDQIIPPFSPSPLLIPARHRRTNLNHDLCIRIQTITGLYPKPVSPPYPDLSREVELRRAMLAESRSTAYGIDSRDVVYEDTWLAVVNKPEGIYCETLLSILSSRPDSPITMSRKPTLLYALGEHQNGKNIAISSGHGRSKFGAWRVYASSDVGRSLPGGLMVRDMTTYFEVLSINGKGMYREPIELDTNVVESIVVEEKGDDEVDNEDNHENV